MAVPAVQIMVNAEQMKVFFDHLAGTYLAYNLYYADAESMAGETVLKRIPNIIDGTYSKSHVIHNFRRSVLGYTESTTFYLRLKGILISTGLEDAGSTGPTKYVPAVEDKIPSYNPVQIQGYDGNVWRRAAADTAGRLDTV